MVINAYVNHVRPLFVLRNRRNADTTEFNRPRTVVRAGRVNFILSRVISGNGRLRSSIYLRVRRALDKRAAREIKRANYSDRRRR